MPRYFKYDELSLPGRCLLNGIVRRNQIQSDEDDEIENTSVERTDASNLILSMYGVDELVAGLLTRDKKRRPINPEYKILEECAKDYGIEFSPNKPDQETLIAALVKPYYYTQKTNEARRAR